MWKFKILALPKFYLSSHLHIFTFLIIRMTALEIRQALKENHAHFINYIMSLRKDDFMFAPIGKWTAGQQFEHIALSVKPLARALLVPKFLLKLVLPKVNRPSMTYNELVQKYQNKLSSGAQATGAFVPQAVPYEQQQQINKKLQKYLLQLDERLANFTEKEMDTLVAPHPLLGKLTLREMLYFTIYHVQHHHEITKRNLGGNTIQDN